MWWVGLFSFNVWGKLGKGCVNSWVCFASSPSGEELEAPAPDIKDEDDDDDENLEQQMKRQRVWS